MELGLSGLASNFDWRSLVDQIANVERLPQRRLMSEQNLLEQRKNAYGSILTQLNILATRVDALKSPDLFQARKASVGDAAAASATASAGAAEGTYTFEFRQLATAARQVGQGNIGGPLHDGPDVSGLSLATAGFAAPITAGSFRVNGALVEVTADDTLQNVFDRIGSATGGAVVGSYDPAQDRIRLDSAGPIVLGSATDTSNFLQVAQLHNNGTGEVSSAGALGSVRLTASLAESNLATTVSDGGAGAGKFRINGVDISFHADDRLDAVLRRINESSAGVTASYDFSNDRFVLANKGTGDMGIALEDVTGNFLAATGLQGGTLDRGRDLLYTVNGGGELRSQSNTIREGSSGLAGVTVTALREGETTTVRVEGDAGAMRKAITDFIDAYNKVQSQIASQTASTTDSEGKVKASPLTADGDADGMSATLRRMVYSPVSGEGLGLRHLESLGIVSNSNDDKLELADPEALDRALAERLPAVRALFSDPDHGLAVRLGSYLTRMTGDEGVVASKQSLLTRQASDIGRQIDDLERIVQSNRARMLDRFVVMEKAQANINQQMQFLMQRFGSTQARV
ncbi:MAG: flagellar filament capping protein FliD [Verrucomicrobiae bacterium]|nr:flagellar filament capping protein FliD [Verrucomicrobiae bacterium]